MTIPSCEREIRLQTLIRQRAVLECQIRDLNDYLIDAQEEWAKEHARAKRYREALELLAGRFPVDEEEGIGECRAIHACATEWCSACIANEALRDPK